MARDPLVIPPPMEAFVDKDGRPAASWYRLLKRLADESNRVAVEAAAGVIAADVGYDNATSGLTAIQAQAAIDEVEGRVDTLETLPPATHTLIASGALSAAATLDIPLDGNTWDEVEISLIDIVPETDNVSLTLLFDQGAGFLVGASDYQYAFTRGGTLVADTAHTAIVLADAAGTGTNERVTLKIHLYRPGDADLIKAVHWAGGYRAQNAAALGIQGWGELIRNNDAIIDARVVMSADDIASGYYYAIGKKYS